MELVTYTINNFNSRSDDGSKICIFERITYHRHLADDYWEALVFVIVEKIHVRIVILSSKITRFTLSNNPYIMISLPIPNGSGKGTSPSSLKRYPGCQRYIIPIQRYTPLNKIMKSRCHKSSRNT